MITEQIVEHAAAQATGPGARQPCEFVIHRPSTKQCGRDGYWLVRTTCPACGEVSRDVLCRDHGTDVFAANGAHFVCPSCSVAAVAPPAVWSRL